MNTDRYWTVVNINNYVKLNAYILKNKQFLNFGLIFIDSTLV